MLNEIVIALLVLDGGMVIQIAKFHFKMKRSDTCFDMLQVVYAMKFLDPYAMIYIFTYDGIWRSGYDRDFGVVARFSFWVREVQCSILEMPLQVIKCREYSFSVSFFCFKGQKLNISIALFELNGRTFMQRRNVLASPCFTC